MMAFLQPPAEYTWSTAWLDGIPGLPQRCLSVTAATAATSHNVLNGAYRATCFEHDEMYVAALHFAVQSVTSIGYGDIVATNHFERSCTVVLMLVSAIGWAWIIGNIVSIASMSAPVEVLYHEKVDLITSYMEKMNIAQSHRIKVRRFLSFSKFAMKVIWHGKHRNALCLTRNAFPRLSAGSLRQSNVARLAAEPGEPDANAPSLHAIPDLPNCYSCVCFGRVLLRHRDASEVQAYAPSSQYVFALTNLGLCN
jgi:hypothetical protein